MVRPSNWRPQVNCIVQECIIFWYVDTTKDIYELFWREKIPIPQEIYLDVYQPKQTLYESVLFIELLFTCIWLSDW